MIKYIYTLYIGILGVAIMLVSSTIMQSNARKKHEFSAGPAANDARQAEQMRLMLADPSTGSIPSNIRQKEIAYYNSVIAPAQKNTRAQKWNAAGPYNVGGRTRSVAIDITNENVLVAGGVSGGIWRSADAGANWQRVSDEGGYMGIVSLCQDTRVGQENVWYGISGELTGNSASGGSAYYFGDGYFKSTDSAKTWQPIVSTAIGVAGSYLQPYQVSWNIVAHPAVDKSRLFVSTLGGILKSEDAGATWNWTLGSFNNNAYYSEVKVSASGVLYAALSSDGLTQGFFRSADSGLTWTNITPSTLIAGHERTTIAINPNNENEVYFFTYLLDSLSACGTLTSNYKGAPEYISLLKYEYLSGNGTNAGGNWTSLSANLPNNANVTTGPFDKLNCQGGYDMFVTVQPTTNAVVIGGTNMYISDDGFTTPNNWRQFGGYQLGTTLPNFQVWDNHHPDCHDLIFYPSNYKKAISASDGGVRLCSNINVNPVTWVSLNNGYITSQLYSVTLDPAPGNHWLLAGFQDNGNFISTNYNNVQEQWVMPFNGDGAYNYIAPNKEFVIMSIQLGRIGKFELDAAGNRVAYRRIDPIGPVEGDYNFINQLVVDPNNDNIMYVPAGKKIYRQSDLRGIALTNAWDSISQGWTVLPDTITTTNITTTRPASIVSIAVSKNNPANLVYIGTDKRDIFRIENANGANPIMKNITKSILPASGYLSSIAVDPANGGNVLIAYSNYGVVSLFYSNDSGNNWRYCGGNLDRSANFSGAQPSVRWVDIMTGPDGKPKYFCGTSIGLYTSDSLWATSVYNKDSTKWIQESINGIGTSVVNHITHRAADYTVAASTHGNGAYWSSYAYPTAVPNIKPLQKEHLAIHLFPNPTSENATLSFTLPQNTNCHIYLTDRLGRKIKTFAQSDFYKGSHNFAINLNNIAKGNYFVHLQTAYGSKQSKQIIIQ